MDAYQFMQEKLASELDKTITFEKRLTVLRARPSFIAPFRKCKFFYVELEDLKTEKRFLDKIEEIAKSWPTSTYYLKLSNGTVFARFDIINGKVRKLFKQSPATRIPYPWTNFCKKFI
jgi:hypothetical protein